MCNVLNLKLFVYLKVYPGKYIIIWYARPTNNNKIIRPAVLSAVTVQLLSQIGGSADRLPIAVSPIADHVSLTIVTASAADGRFADPPMWNEYYRKKYYYYFYINSCACKLSCFILFIEFTLFNYLTIIQIYIYLLSLMFSTINNNKDKILNCFYAFKIYFSKNY